MRHAVADSRRAERMLDRNRLEAELADPERHIGANNVPVIDGEAIDQRPGLRRGKHRARRALGEPRGVVVMSMGEHDRRRRQGPNAPEPIGAAIDHDACVALPHHKGAMAKVASRPELDLAARAEKGNVDGDRP